MKLIVQVPCYNEEEALPVSLPAIPRSVPGMDRVEVLVIDDGSSDRTVEIARTLGADHILPLGAHRGLAAAFSAGVLESLRLGADVIVNTDADNQYRASDIPALVRPLLDGAADVVVGDRGIDRNRDISFFKRKLQKHGSAVVSFLSGIRVPDTTSGFRAFSREAALRMNILTDYSYTLESLIQLAHLKYRILSVPVGTNPPLRASRLLKNNLAYVASQAGTIIRVFTIYKPLRTFFLLGTALAVPGLAALGRYLFHLARGRAAGHAHWLLLSVILIASGAVAAFVGLVADLVGGNRKLAENALLQLKRIELGDKGNGPGPGGAEPR